MAYWYYPAAVNIVLITALGLQAKVIDNTANTATNAAAAADGENANPSKAADSSTSMSANAAEKTSTSGG
ncbi:TPA: hypothetical protein ACH3X2_008388 [Trebouxia sp. C0005]